eukprot:scaffold23606_cov108-Isochrysis_galbana.AAC.4
MEQCVHWRPGTRRALVQAWQAELPPDSGVGAKGELTCWNRLSVNCNRRHDLPTPVSPMMMYLPVGGQYQEQFILSLALWMRLPRRAGCFRDSVPPRPWRSTCDKRSLAADCNDANN